MPRHWMLRIDNAYGPWVSLGIHIDLGAPHIAIHFLWWIVTIGRQYHGGAWEVPRGKPRPGCNAKSSTGGRR